MRQKACVSWDNIKTSYFSMSNGVKQGGVVSSIVPSFALSTVISLVVGGTVYNEWFHLSLL